MGVLPQLKKPLLHLKPRNSTQKPSVETQERAVATAASVLPLEAQQLKMQILASHPERLVRFSVSRMRHVAAHPPVEIPADLSNKKLLKARVAGHSVPLTRTMWDNMRKEQKKKTRGLHIIGEGIRY